MERPDKLEVHVQRAYLYPKPPPLASAQELQILPELSIGWFPQVTVARGYRTIRTMVVLGRLWAGLKNVENSANAPTLTNSVADHYNLTAEIVESRHTRSAV